MFVEILRAGATGARLLAQKALRHKDRGGFFLRKVGKKKSMVGRRVGGRGQIRENGDRAVEVRWRGRETAPQSG